MAMKHLAQQWVQGVGIMRVSLVMMAMESVGLLGDQRWCQHNHLQIINVQEF